MRGDSLRDLYAKTLALLGLGVLAGAGALVDYLPVGFTLPRVSSALITTPTTIETPSVNDAVEPRVVPVRSLPGRSRVQVAAAPLVALPATGLGEEPVGQLVTLVAPVARDGAQEDRLSLALADHTEVATFAMVADSSALSELPGDATYQPSALVSAGDTDGFITGAFKKTGTSIVKTSVRTGASIFDAVRVVGGVVRRALPN